MTAIHVAFCPFVKIIYYRKKKKRCRKQWYQHRSIQEGIDTKLEVSIEHIPQANVCGVDCYNYSSSAECHTQGLIASH